MCLDSVKKPETFLKKLITEAGHVLKMCLFYAKSEPRCAYRLGAYKLKCVYFFTLLPSLFKPPPSLSSRPSCPKMPSTN